MYIYMCISFFIRPSDLSSVNDTVGLDAHQREAEPVTEDAYIMVIGTTCIIILLYACICVALTFHRVHPNEVKRKVVVPTVKV